MISRLRGTLVEKQAPFLYVEVVGLTYEVQTSMNTFYRLPEMGQELILHTHFIVREDGHFLFGFSETRERLLFRTLLKVNGVGPKVALAILSSVSPDEFADCVANNRVAALQRLPGIGKKTAERLIIEMRDRLAAWSEVKNYSASPNISSADTRMENTERDATSALIALGYKPAEATRIIAQLNRPDLSSEELIRAALKRDKF